MYIFLKTFNQMIDDKLWLLYSNTWKHLIVSKQMSNSK